MIEFRAIPSGPTRRSLERLLKGLGVLTGRIDALPPPGISQAAADTRYVNTTGDTMTGALAVSPSVQAPQLYATDAVPNGANACINRTYADDNYVNSKTNDTMTGSLGIGSTFSTPAGTDGNTTPGWNLIAAGTSRTLTDSTAVGLPNIRASRGGSSGGTGEDFVQFVRRASGVDTTVGTIRLASGTTIAYNTSSDPGRKRRVGPLTDALTRVRRLAGRAYRGRWKADCDGQEWDFLNGDDVAEAAPYATSRHEGEWFVDYSKLVPLLVAAIGDLAERVDALQGSV